MRTIGINPQTLPSPNKQPKKSKSKQKRNENILESQSLKNAVEVRVKEIPMSLELGGGGGWGRAGRAESSARCLAGLHLGCGGRTPPEGIEIFLYAKRKTLERKPEPRGHLTVLFSLPNCSGGVWHLSFSQRGLESRASAGSRIRCSTTVSQLPWLSQEDLWPSQDTENTEALERGL